MKHENFNDMGVFGAFDNFEDFLKAVKRDRRFNHDIESDDGICYVYLVTCKRDDKKYYGSRKSKHEDLEFDFWKYCTSSVRKKDIKKNKEDYEVEIVRTFNNFMLSGLYESYLHLKYDVCRNDDYFNKWNAPIFGFNTRGFITVKDEADSTRGKLIPIEEYDSEIHERFTSRYGQTVAKDHDGNTFSISVNDPSYGTEFFNVNKEMVTVALKESPGRYFVVDKVEFLSNREKYITSKEGYKAPEKVRKKYSQAAKSRPILECPYCDKNGHPSNMNRWHFDNCPRKPGNEGLKRKCPNRKYHGIEYK